MSSRDSTRAWMVATVFVAVMIVTGGWLWANTGGAPRSPRIASSEEPSATPSAGAPTEATIAVPGDTGVGGGGACAADTEVNLRLRFEHAAVIFLGTARPGRDGAIRHGPNAEEELYSPARFEVVEYVKGSGPDHVLVETATKELDGERSVTGSGGLDAHEGDRWLVYGYDHGQYEETGIYSADGCSSTLLSAAP